MAVFPCGFTSVTGGNICCSQHTVQHNTLTAPLTLGMADWLSRQLDNVGLGKFGGD